MGELAEGGFGRSLENSENLGAVGLPNLAGDYRPGTALSQQVSGWGRAMSLRILKEVS
jgi:hypothetical protein